jgi:hypothetical protein
VDFLDSLDFVDLKRDVSFVTYFHPQMKHPFSYPAYLVTKDIAQWQPTPPDYMETNWRTLRPFTLDTVSQFRPETHLFIKKKFGKNRYLLR